MTIKPSSHESTSVTRDGNGLHGTIGLREPVIVHQTHTAIDDSANGAEAESVGELNHGRKKSLRVLIVEDSEADTGLLLLELQRNGYEPSYERVETPEAMRAALDRQPWDAVISDSSMPRFSSRAALSVLKEKGVDVPFLILSGTIGQETAASAMKDGADDYIPKSDMSRLVPALERELGDVIGHQARRRAEQALGARVRQQATVASLGQRALWVTDLQKLLDLTADLVAKTLEVDYCKVVEIHPGLEIFQLRAGVGWKVESG